MDRHAAWASRDVRIVLDCVECGTLAFVQKRQRPGMAGIALDRVEGYSRFEGHSGEDVAIVLLGVLNGRCRASCAGVLRGAAGNAGGSRLHGRVGGAGSRCFCSRPSARRMSSCARRQRRTL